MKRRISRKALQGMNWGVFLLLSLAALIIVNYFSYRYYHRWDLTAGKTFSLSDQTCEVLRNLDQELTVVVFLAPGDDVLGKVRDLLNAYEEQSAFVKVEYIDPERQIDRMQLLAGQYGITMANAVVFQVGEQSKFVEKDEMVEYDFSGFQATGSPQIKAFKGEEAFTNAILEVLHPTKRTIYFTSGHGERIDRGPGEGLGMLTQRLTREGTRFETWMSLGKTTVPPDCDLLVVAGPSEPFTAPEAEVLARYLEGGGRALFLMDPMLTEGANLDFGKHGLEELLHTWGVSPRRDLAVDLQGAVPMLGMQTFYSHSFGAHEIVEDLERNKLPVVLSLASSLEDGEPPEGYVTRMLLETSSQAWGERDLNSLENVDQGDEDTPGPLVLAAAVYSEDAEKQTRVVAAGDADLASDMILESSPGNMLFCTNAVHWLLSQEDRIAIPPRTAIETQLQLTASQVNFLLIFFLFFLPGVIAVLAVWVYLRRRR